MITAQFLEELAEKSNVILIDVRLARHQFGIVDVMRAGVCFSPSTFYLLLSERQPGSDLKHARTPGARNPAEVRAVHVCLGIVVIFPVQQVENVASNL